MDRRRQTIAVALVADLVAVVAFAALGSRSHDGGGAGEVLGIAAPFAVGTAVGWLLSPHARRAPASARAGVDVWAATVVVGLLARRFVWDRGTALSFAIVTTVVLAVALVGWRLLVAAVTHRREVRSARPPTKAER